MTKKEVLLHKQMLAQLQNQQGDNESLKGSIKNREDRLVEQSNEIVRMQSVIDEVEQENRDLHVKSNLLQNKINMLTSALKSTTSIL